MPLIPLGLRYIPADHPSAAQRTSAGRRRLDVIGMLLLRIGIAAGMLALTRLGSPDARVLDWRFLGPAVVSAVFITWFWCHIGRTANPFMEPGLIRGGGFGAVNMVSLVYGGVVSGAISLVPLYATNRYGLQVLNSDTLLAAQGWPSSSCLRWRRSRCAVPAIAVRCTSVRS